MWTSTLDLTWNDLALKPVYLPFVHQVARYLADQDLSCRYLHSEIDTLDRVQILRELREGQFDVLVGVNLLREGLDLPEVSLVSIMDADKTGFLRSPTSLIQQIGRAARNVNATVVLYADSVTPAMQAAIRTAVGTSGAKSSEVQTMPTAPAVRGSRARAPGRTCSSRSGCT